MPRTSGAKSLKPAQIAAIMGALLTRHDATLEELAVEFGVSMRTITEYKAQLPQVLCVENATSIAHAREDKTPLVVEALRDFVVEGLGAMRKIVNKVNDETWLDKQDAQGLASAFSAISERTLFVLGRSTAATSSSGQPS